MAKKAENGKITKIEKPYGGSTVKERKAAMSRGLTEEELKARNIIPETNPARHAASYHRRRTLF